MKKKTKKKKKKTTTETKTKKKDAASLLWQQEVDLFCALSSVMSNIRRVFTTSTPVINREPAGNLKEHGMEVTPANRESPGPRVRELQVTGAAEVSCPADRASLRVSVSSSKESVNEATNSVSRRLEYILQAIRWTKHVQTHTFTHRSYSLTHAVMSR